ncbi:putative Indole-3-acetyl-aspartic acid hydrolase [Paratrimastix pyriformis]|uniref:Indole-3-acetyl-aspartic acid hydrolase n=1 Tax=Paratrimastix pyriformis TaxID=342808 RepID=A0ABQ8UWL1_9EUKA|nr:putative Indole-3-acetyl-aspartic acid hydrolase [Paratrimastix pyriformis]
MSTKTLSDFVGTLASQLRVVRRDLHKHAEAGWTEFRTGSLVIQELRKIGGWDVVYGPSIFSRDHMAGLPDASVLKTHQERAIAQGADPALVAAMTGGFTGVVATMGCGQGPTVALRFDMDALDLNESTDPAHRPVAEGFASQNPGAMHACGHDGHVAIGLGVARTLAAFREELHGTVKLIFQPAEEGVRGARAMAEAGVVDGVDYLLAAHLGFKATRTGLVICETSGFLATSKLDAVFTGVPAHAGAAPHTGKNALLAAAAGVLNLHAIARHGEGASRINVGVLQAGTGRNVVPDRALLKLETRGETTAIDGFMLAEAQRVLRGAAAMWDVDIELRPMGCAAGARSDPALAAVVHQAAAETPAVHEIEAAGGLGGSEDCTWFMDRVQRAGGMACYAMVGTALAAAHHDSRFDIDEASLPIGVEVLARAAMALLRPGGGPRRPQ